MAATAAVVPFYYGHRSQSANQYIWYAKSPVSGQLQLKASPVAVRRLSFVETEPCCWCGSRN